MPKTFRFALVLLLLAAPRARAWDSPAPDVVLYCTPALQAPLRRAADEYSAARHVKVHILVGSPNGQAGLIRHRARADVIVAETAMIGVLEGEKLVRADTIVPLGENAFVLIGSKDAGLPRGAGALGLLTAHMVVLPDPTTAASFDGAAVLRAAFPRAAPFSVMGVADTPTVIALIEHDANLLGVVNRTEADGADVVQAAALPAPPVAFAAALVSNGQSRNAASLLAFITGPEGRAILRQAGMEIIS